MEIIEKIRKEIERLKEYAKSSKMEWESEGYNQNAFAEDCRISSFNKLLTFLDSLQEETSEPYTGKYDEAYLQEKIAKATKSWEGVDVDKYMDEVRGVETPKDLEEEVDRFFDEMPVQEHENIFEDTYQMIARHFYELGKNSK